MLLRVHRRRRAGCGRRFVPATWRISKQRLTCHSSNTLFVRPFACMHLLAARCASTPAQRPNALCHSSTRYGYACRPGVGFLVGSDTVVDPQSVEKRRTAGGTCRAVSIFAMATLSPFLFSPSTAPPIFGAPMLGFSGLSDGPHCRRLCGPCRACMRTRSRF